MSSSAEPMMIHSDNFYYIPVEKIAVIDRGRRNLGDLADLAASLKANGQIQAGVVREAMKADEDEGVDPSQTPWILVAGGRRYAAACLAGLDMFKAENLGDLPPLEQKVLEIEENLGRKDLEWDELTAMRAEVHRLRTQQAEEAGEKWSLADTAQEIGQTAGNLSKDVRLDEELQKDPTLKGAGSKKAAIRIIEFREHLARQEMKMGRGLSTALRSAVVTADASDWWRAQATGSIDLCLSDFPYAYDYHSLARKDSPDTYSTDYDDSEAVNFDLFIDIVPEIIRTTKVTGWLAIFMAESNQGMLRDLFESCCATHFSYGTIEYVVKDGEWTKVMPEWCSAVGVGAPNSDVNTLAPCKFLRAEVPSWIWYRPNSRNPGRLPERHAKNFYEPILVVNRGEARLYKHQDECPNVLVHDAEYGVERIHANQKPMSLAEDIVQRCSLPGEVVADSFFGSGNLLAGAAKHSRSIRGCDSAVLMLEPALANISNYYGG